MGKIEEATQEVVEATLIAGLQEDWENENRLREFSEEFDSKLEHIKSVLDNNFTLGKNLLPFFEELPEYVFSLWLERANITCMPSTKAYLRELQRERQYYLYKISKVECCVIKLLQRAKIDFIDVNTSKLAGAKLLSAYKNIAKSQEYLDIAKKIEFKVCQVSKTLEDRLAEMKFLLPWLIYELKIIVSWEKQHGITVADEDLNNNNKDFLSNENLDKTKIGSLGQIPESQHKNRMSGTDRCSLS